MMIKKASISVLSLFCLCLVFGQKDDLAFKGFKSGNTRFSVYVQSDINISTIVGSDANEYRKAISHFKHANGLNTAKAGLRFGPSVQLLTYFKTKADVEIGFSLKYSINGWREIYLDKLNSSNLVRNAAWFSFHSMGIPLSVRYAVNDNFSIKGGYVPSILLSGKIVLKRKLIIGGQKETSRETYQFEDVFSSQMRTFYSSFFSGVEVGSEMVRFSGTISLSTAFTKEGSQFMFIQTEFGIIYRLNQ